MLFGSSVPSSSEIWCNIYIQSFYLFLGTDIFHDTYHFVGNRMGVWEPSTGTSHRLPKPVFRKQLNNRVTKNRNRTGNVTSYFYTSIWSALLRQGHQSRGLPVAGVCTCPSHRAYYRDASVIISQGPKFHFRRSKFRL
jgi:hypothetical protein